MSISNLRQNIHNRQYAIYNYLMPIYDADKFAEWLVNSFEKSNYKSYAALADEAGLSRSSVSALAGAKKQPLTDKPSQPKPETVINLANALNEDVNLAMNLAGYASVSKTIIPDKLAVLDYDGLDTEDIEDIAEYIEFKRLKKRKSNNRKTKKEEPSVHDEFELSPDEVKKKPR